MTWNKDIRVENIFKSIKTVVKVTVSRYYKKSHEHSQKAENKKGDNIILLLLF